MDRTTGIAAFGAACAALLCLGPTLTRAEPARTVAPTEQARRDSDRLQILRTELDRERQRAAATARQHAQRLAAGDLQGAAEAQAARERSGADIAALEREIQAALRQQPGPAALPPALKAASVRVPSPSPAEASTSAWWDVYARPPRRASSSLLPPGTAAVPSVAVPAR